jgi:hypothetical protein
MWCKDNPGKMVLNIQLRQRVHAVTHASHPSCAGITNRRMAARLAELQTDTYLITNQHKRYLWSSSLGQHLSSMVKTLTLSPTAANKQSWAGNVRNTISLMGKTDVLTIVSSQISDIILNYFSFVHSPVHSHQLHSSYGEKHSWLLRQFM